MLAHSPRIWWIGPSASITPYKLPIGVVTKLMAMHPIEPGLEVQYIIAHHVDPCVKPLPSHGDQMHEDIFQPMFVQTKESWRPRYEAILPFLLDPPLTKLSQANWNKASAQCFFLTCHPNRFLNAQRTWCGCPRFVRFSYAGAGLRGYLLTNGKLHATISLHLELQGWAWFECLITTAKPR